ncbi:conserved hypothetical protein [Neospora caninum Liverpool]|uniref:BTB domain-containing protein n=1 Tax=Neospora caninum (strain Liverpool) TaxID=572307 RepID=F0VBZ0_NEOCL|nr:conserved hypothetical protein [Neospora caninum Liverpool]CBZ51124.1 conserved hypothetical protein [Neospora caninum Liverpool]|eukprot:XP_003881157.1 conserved hypothetical protein [Neospora caninum Liverpool]
MHITIGGRNMETPTNGCEDLSVNMAPKEEAQEIPQFDIQELDVFTEEDKPQVEVPQVVPGGRPQPPPSLSSSCVAEHRSQLADGATPGTPAAVPDNTLFGFGQFTTPMSKRRIELDWFVEDFNVHRTRVRDKALPSNCPPYLESPLLDPLILPGCWTFRLFPYYRGEVKKNALRVDPSHKPLIAPSPKKFTGCVALFLFGRTAIEVNSSVTVSILDAKGEPIMTRSTGDNFQLFTVKPAVMMGFEDFIKAGRLPSEEGPLADAVFLAGPGGERVYCSKFLLYSRCPGLRSLLHDQGSGLVIIPDEEFSVDIIRDFCFYLYFDVCPILQTVKDAVVSLELPPGSVLGADPNSQVKTKGKTASRISSRAPTRASTPQHAEGEVSNLAFLLKLYQMAHKYDFKSLFAAVERAIVPQLNIVTAGSILEAAERCNALNITAAARRVMGLVESPGSVRQLGLCHRPEEIQEETHRSNANSSAFVPDVVFKRQDTDSAASSHCLADAASAGGCPSPVVSN